MLALRHRPPNPRAGPTLLVFPPRSRRPASGHCAWYGLPGWGRGRTRGRSGVPPEGGGRTVRGWPVAAGPHLGVAQEQDTADQVDNDPERVAVYPAPVVQPV